MPTIRVVDRRGESLKIPIQVDAPRRTLLSELQKAGQEMIGQCGGHGICGQCKVTINSGKFHDVQEPMASLPDNQKLACCISPDLSDDDMDVTLERAAFIPPKP